MNIQKIKKTENLSGKLKNYTEVVDFLNSRKKMAYDQNVLERMKQLDKHFDNISQKIDTVLVGGANGKSLAMHFATKLLKEEGFSVGCAYSSHFLNYNERFALDGQTISTKDFADVASSVIDVVESNKIDATAFEIVTIASLIYFKAQNVDVILLEVGVGGKYDATNFASPVISAVTRIAQDHKDKLGDDLEGIMAHMLEIARPDSWFISAEQSKLRLQKMKIWVEGHGAKWAMPIRKLATLPYIYEQLYGRTVSLGERVAQIYVEDVKKKFSPFLRGNLLATKQGQRGRPTLEAKRQSELNPLKTLKLFWNDRFDLLKGRFELLDKEKPTILLDNAHNLDAYENLFLGVRLLNYQKPLKGFALIIGLGEITDNIEALKNIRYLLKKVSGHVFFVPLVGKVVSHDPKELAIKAKEMGFKAKAYENLAQAFEAAKNVVDARDGLVCITGSCDMVAEYWKNRGIKKV